MREVLRNFDPNMTPIGFNEGYLNLQKQIDTIDSDLKEIFGDSQNPETLKQIEGDLNLNFHFIGCGQINVWLILIHLKRMTFQYGIQENSYLSRHARVYVICQ